MTDTNHMDKSTDMPPPASELLTRTDAMRPSCCILDAISSLPRLELAMIITLVVWMFI